MHLFVETVARLNYASLHRVTADNFFNPAIATTTDVVPKVVLPESRVVVANPFLFQVPYH